MHNLSLPILPTTFLALAIFLYVRGWLHLRKAFPRTVKLGSIATFICGITSVWFAVASPLAMLDHELLSAHMVQHLLLMAVGAPLILMGRPVLPLLLGTPKYLVQPRLASFLRLSPVRRLGRIAIHPVFCWIVATITVIGWHLPAIFTLALHSALWHGIQYSSFLLAGFLFWWPVIQPWPSATHPAKWSVPFYLFLATLPCDALSAFLTFCGRVVYPSYLFASRPFGISALQDQEWAGVLMWVCVTFIYMVPALTLTVRMLSPTVSGDPQIVPTQILGAARFEVT